MLGAIWVDPYSLPTMTAQQSVGLCVSDCLDKFLRVIEADGLLIDVCWKALELDPKIAQQSLAIKALRSQHNLDVGRLLPFEILCRLCLIPSSTHRTLHQPRLSRFNARVLQTK
uniref:Uncharacterized protein n=1 Tax=Guillardia theta TaxID=55529 RepID=A0A7S4K8N0_GUITH